MVVLILVFWGLSQYIPNGAPINWKDWALETSIGQNDELSRQMAWEKLLIESHKSCNYIFYGPQMELNGSPIGDRVIKTLNTKALAPQIDEKLKGWGMDRGQVERFVQSVCQVNPLQESLKDKTNSGIVYDSNLRTEVLATLRSLLSSLPDTSTKPQLNSALAQFEETDWGTNNPNPFSQKVNLNFNDSILPGSCIRKKNWVPYASIPPLLIKAFMAAEDKEFLTHNGISFPGLIRAALKKGGGSTITLQTIKNLYFQCDQIDTVQTIKNVPPRWQRKIKEFVLARSFEQSWGKEQIIEAYLNVIYFGNGADGVYEAAKKYFNKPLEKLDLEEMAILASIPNNPNLLTRSSEFPRLLERSQYVLGQMQENNWIDEATRKKQEGLHTSLGYFTSSAGFSKNHYLSSMIFELKKKNIKVPEKARIVGQINSPLQSLVHNELMEGLIQFETRSGKAKVKPVSNLLSVYERIKSEAPAEPAPNTPDPWLTVLDNYKIVPPVDTWKKAIITGINNRNSIQVLIDGAGSITMDPRIMPDNEKREWSLGDVLWLKGTESYKGKKVSITWKIQFMPHVEGAVMVMDVHTGAVYAISSSNLVRNNAIQAWRQPGSTLKPFTYLYALENGLSPMDLVGDRPITLPSIGRGGPSWSPKNYDDISYQDYPMRVGLELSKNLMTVNILKKLNESEPFKTLDGIIGLTQSFGIYPNAPAQNFNPELFDTGPEEAPNCVKDWDCGLGAKAPSRFYPFILGAQETNLLNMVTAYSQIANGGFRVQPSFIKQIFDEGTGKAVYTAPIDNSKLNIKESSLTQLKSMMMGVLRRGTAQSASHLLPYVAGKTGTSNDQKDAWFIGYSSSLAVGVWIGYGTPENLGKGQTGGSLALPVVDRIFTKLFSIDDGKPREDLAAFGYIPQFIHAPIMQETTPELVKLKFDRYSGCFIGDELQSPYEDGEVEEWVDAKIANKYLSAGPSIQCLQKRYFNESNGELPNVSTGTED